ncbi:MAG: YbhB/YbcL family Raf kinase inhibitor-like protein [Zoogloeaceae bacterium]|jgi:Raf kinase inhibitor-like YbhB/YbcL family protein|nr:YbhB/YbcL family Raf kinase inhibitor-like protein [Zoogloeaceae bacterium]
MKLICRSFADGGVIPADFAFGKTDAKSHVALSKNRNPAFAWEDVPAGTKSFALICHDPDAPQFGDGVNHENFTVPAFRPRGSFFHWSLFDLSANRRDIAEGEFSDGVTIRGKNAATKDGARQGINDYTAWHAGDPDMKGDYFGYDGPCPPWNDAIAHRYFFTLYALDVEQLDVPDKPTCQQVQAALGCHVLEAASIMGTYSLNPEVEK